LITITELPSIHPSFGTISSFTCCELLLELLPLTPLAIPTEFNGGNHTKAFTISAASNEAHIACLNISKALALTGLRVLTDDELVHQVIDLYS
jgi:hypothetical protein